MKTCSKCNELKPFGMFGKNKSRKDGYEYWCKQCKKPLLNIAANKWRKSNPGLYKKHIDKHMVSIPPGVYMIKNLITKECYVGQSARPYQRRVQHFAIHSKGSGASVKSLQLAMKQYGPKSFVFGIIEYCKPEQLLEREQYYIDLFNPEYNLK
jgi:hypothetical protein